MPDVVPSRKIGEQTFPDIAKLVTARAILCLPFGSVEQHGPHLPLNTDAVLAEEFTRRILARWGEALDLWQLPALAIGLAREHEWAPGTLSLSVEGMTALVHDLGRTIARALPTRNLAIVNCHGGNRGILDALILDLAADYDLNVCVLHPTVWAEGMESTHAPDIHGGKVETSLMLAAAPHLVRMQRLGDVKPPAADKVGQVILDPAVSWPWTSDDERIASMGVIGDAKAASAAFGERLFAHAVEKAGGALKALAER